MRKTLYVLIRLKLSQKTPYVESFLNMSSGETSYLSARIDWCQFNLKAKSVDYIFDEILKCPKSIFTDSVSSGFHGYVCLLEFNSIKILYSELNDDFMVLMSGSGCRGFEMILKSQNVTWTDFFKRCFNKKIKFGRIDVAIDDTKTYFSIPKIIQKVKKGECLSRLRTSSIAGEIDIKSGEPVGQTIYFGSSKSDFRIVFYEKNFEQAKKFSKTIEEAKENRWNRYELRFRHEKADELVSRLFDEKSIMKSTLEVLKFKLTFLVANKGTKDKRKWKVYQPWQYFLKDVEPVDILAGAKEISFKSTVLWLTKSVAPTLKIMRNLEDEFNVDILDYLIKNAKMQDKHSKINERFSKELQNILDDSSKNSEEVLKEIFKDILVEVD